MDDGVIIPGGVEAKITTETSLGLRFWFDFLFVLVRFLGFCLGFCAFGGFLLVLLVFSFCFGFFVWGFLFGFGGVCLFLFWRVVLFVYLLIFPVGK